MTHRETTTLAPLNFDQAYEWTCPDCEGTGQRGRSPLPCRRCHGRGKIIPEHLEGLWEAYQEALGAIFS